MFKLDNDKVIRKFSFKNAPALTVSSGDEVELITMNAFGDQKMETGDGPFYFDPDIAGNPATGPVYIKEAKKGDVLKVSVLSIEPFPNVTMGMGTDMGVFADETDMEHTRLFDIVDGHTVFFGKELKNNPMLGVIGVAPAEPEEIDTMTPGDHGGNMDCNRITEGCAVYLPVFVDGALLAIGDVHALMGDGEVSSGGAEVPATVKVKVEVIKDEDITCPFVVSEGYVMCIKSKKTIDEAARSAVKTMKNFVQKKFGISHVEASMLMSLIGNIRICQMVDPLMSCRMEVPVEIFEKYGYKMK